MASLFPSAAVLPGWEKQRLLNFPFLALCTPDKGIYVAQGMRVGERHFYINLDKTDLKPYTCSMPGIETLFENEYIFYIKKILPCVKHSFYAIIYVAYPHLNRRSDDVKLFLDDIVSMHKKSIAVKILFNSTENKSLVSRANKISYDYLRKNGVEVRTTKKGRTTHAKLMIIDDNISILGSHNLSTTSLHKSREISVVLTDDITNSKMKDYFFKYYCDAV